MKNLYKITTILLLVLMTASCTIEPSNYNNGNGPGDCEYISNILSAPPITCEKTSTGIDERCITNIITMQFNDNSVIPSVIRTYGPTTWVVETIRQIMVPATAAIYGSIGGNAGFVRTVQAALTLVVMFYALGVVLGVAQANPYSVFMVAVKILIVFELSTNYASFQEWVIDIFEGLVSGLTQVTSNILNPPIDASAVVGGNVAANTNVSGNTFAVIDNMLSMVFSTGFFKLLAALLTTSNGGVVYFFLFLFFMAIYFITILAAVQTFLMALIARYLLYALAPLFIAFALFAQSKSLFEGWLKLIISYSLQPVFLFTFIGMFQTMIMGYLTTVMSTQSQTVCYRKWFDLVADFFWYRLGNSVTGSGLNPDVSLNLWTMMSIIIVSLLMKGMIDWTVQVSSRMSDGLVTATGMPIMGWQLLKQQGVQKGVAMASGMTGGLGGALFGTKTVGGGTLNRTGGLLNPRSGGSWSSLSPSSIIRRTVQGGRAGANQAYQAGKVSRKGAVDRAKKDTINDILGKF